MSRTDRGPECKCLLALLGKNVAIAARFCCNRCQDMRIVRFTIRLPFFLIAEAALWCAALFGSHIGLHRESEALEQHRRLVDWL